jgi:oligopeptide transport system substrate-binding protein
MSKKLFFASQVFLLLGLVSIILAGCGTKNSSGPNLAANQVLRLANIGTQDIHTTDPAQPTDLNSAQAITLMYTGLVKLDPATLEVKPDIASGWQVTNGGMTYTFHLRSGIKFSNGDPVTAQDFAYTLDRTSDPCLQPGPSPVAPTYMGDIVGFNDRYNAKCTSPASAPSLIGKGVVALDDTTLQINLDKPIGFFLDQLTYSTAYVVDKNIINQDGDNWSDQHSAGTGPFMLKSWQHNSKLVFVPNPNWYGTKSKLTEIDMPEFQLQSTAFQAFQGKQIDVDNFIDSSGYPIAKNGGKSKQWNFFEGPYLAINYITGNDKIPPFDNVAVRQAFAETVDRDTISNQVLGGLTISSDHIIPKGMPGYNPSLKGLPFDPNDAKQKLLLAYPDLSKLPPITFEYNKGTDADKVAAQMKQDWQKYLGVNVTLNAVDFEKLVTDVLTNQVQFYGLAWIADYPDPQDWTTLQFTTYGLYDNMNFDDPKIDDLVKQADVEQDQAKRYQLYNQVEELAVQEEAWAPYSQYKNVYVYQNNVHGYVLDAGGLTPPDVWANVYICNGTCNS